MVKNYFFNQAKSFTSEKNKEQGQDLNKIC